MIRAGRLRELLAFKTRQRVRTASGATEDVYTEVYRCKGEKLKLTAIAADVNAYEQFLGDTVAMRVRYHPAITEQCRVVWQGHDYEIRLMDRGTDNSYTLTLRRLNL